MATDKSAKNTATPAIDDFSNWSEEQIGFAPYLNPEEGLWFTAIPLMLDARDPKFHRFLFEKTRIPLECHRGPASGAEAVTVKPGESFSLSVYFQLEEAIKFYMASGIRPECRIECLDKVKTSEGNQVWRFKVSVAPETRKLLEAKRAEFKKLADKEKASERPSLEA